MDEDFLEPPAPPRGPPRALDRAYAWVRRRRHPRVAEFLFFALPGAALALAAAGASAAGLLPSPLAILGEFGGVLLAGFGLLPPVPAAAPPEALPARSRRRRR